MKKMLIKYSKKDFNTNYISSLYARQEKYLYSKDDLIKIKNECENLSLDLRKFLRLVENNLYDFYETFTEEEKSILNTKVKKQALHSQVLDCIYHTLYNISIPQKYYYFYNPINNEYLLEFRFESFKDYQGVKVFLDYYYRKVTLFRRTFYLEKCLNTYRIYYKNKISVVKKELTKLKKKQYKEERLLLEQIRILTKKIQITDLEFSRKILTNNLLNIKLLDNDTLNFTKLLTIFTEENTFEDFLIFIERVNTKYLSYMKNKYKEDQFESSFEKQVKDYMNQIGLYVSFILSLQRKHSKLNQYNILNMEEDIQFSFRQEENFGFCEVTFVPLKDIFIKCPKIEDLDDFFKLNDIVIYTNRFIALLNLMEAFYFNKLFFIFLKYIENAQDNK